MPKALNVRIGSAADALDRFEAAWHLATGRAAPAPLAVLSFADLPLLLQTLTPARWELLRQLAKLGAVSVFALAKHLKRDYKNVHTDVARLVDLGLIERTGTAEIRIGYEAVRAELKL
jgi:predicted transcriptional regulator